MSEQGTLEKKLRRWMENGGDLAELLGRDCFLTITTQLEVEAICESLEKLMGMEERMLGDFDAPMTLLSRYFQQVGSQEALEAFRNLGLPIIRRIVKCAVAGEESIDLGRTMFLLKLLAIYYQEPHDVEIICEAARIPLGPQENMWSAVLGAFAGDHPGWKRVVEVLSTPLPVGFIRVAFLDLVNQLSIRGVLTDHPFNTTEGVESLEAMITNPHEDAFSYAGSATTSLPFLNQANRDRVLSLALRHPLVKVRMEAAWAQAKCNDMAGVDRLVEWCLNVNTSRDAQELLRELGREDWIPESARNAEFRAAADLAAWLAHPNEIGRAPDRLELLGKRTLYWPPTEDERELFVFKYTYEKGANENDVVGIGMTGSITFALFGVTTLDMPIEDIYGLHCFWELRQKGDTRAQGQLSAEIGRAILREHNGGF